MEVGPGPFGIVDEETHHPAADGLPVGESHDGEGAKSVSTTKCCPSPVTYVSTAILLLAAQAANGGLGEGSGLPRRAVDRDSLARFVVVQRFQGGELRVKQVGRQEVARRAVTLAAISSGEQSR